MKNIFINPYTFHSYKELDEWILSINKKYLGDYYSFIMTKYIILSIADGDIKNEIRSKILSINNDGKIETYKKMIGVIKTVGEKLDTVLYDKNYLPRIIEFKTWVWSYERNRREIKKAINKLCDVESSNNFYPIGNKMCCLNVLFHMIYNRATDLIINKNKGYSKNLGPEPVDGKWDISKCIDKLKEVLIYKLTGKKVTNLKEATANFKEIDMDKIYFKAEFLIYKSYSKGENYV